MKQKRAKSAIDEFGYQVNAEDFRFPALGKLYCFYCTCRMKLVLAQDGREAHFLHDITLLGPDDVCPNLETPRFQKSS